MLTNYILYTKQIQVAYFYDMVNINQKNALSMCVQKTFYAFLYSLLLLN